MKKLFALVFAGLSGLYLMTIGILPDALPFIDEGVAMLVLVQSLAVLGIDIRRFLPFIGRKDPRGGKAGKKEAGRVIDV